MGARTEANEANQATDGADRASPVGKPGPFAGRAGEPGRAGPREWPARLGFGLLFIAVLGVAAALRFADLATNPGSLYWDEASEGLDAVRMLREPGYHPIWLVWFVNDGGREALFAYVVSGAFAILGPSALVLREVAAAFGVAGVAAIGALAARWGRAPALAASGWAAGSLWLVAISRDGMRNTMVPLFGAVALIAILHWAAHPSRRTAALAGAVTSVAALYTYQPLKLLPLLVIVWLWWLRRVGGAGRSAAGAATQPATQPATYDALRATLRPAIVAFLIVAAPMAAAAITEPANYFGRVATTSFANPWIQASVPYPVHVLNVIGMFGFVGDPNPRHDVAALPLLPLPLTLVALFGLRRLWRARHDPAHSLILLALPTFLLPTLLFPDGGSPHFLRSLGLAAPLGVTIGLGALELVEMARRARGRWRGATAAAAAAVARLVPATAAALIAATLIGVAGWSGAATLNRSLADRWVAYDFAANEMAKLAAAQPDAAVIPGQHFTVDVRFLTYEENTAILDPAPIPNPKQYSRVFALDRADLEKALGTQAAAEARPVVFDPWGKPAVWAVTP